MKKYISLFLALLMCLLLTTPALANATADETATDSVAEDVITDETESTTANNDDSNGSADGITSEEANLSLMDDAALVASLADEASDSISEAAEKVEVQTMQAQRAMRATTFSTASMNRSKAIPFADKDTAITRGSLSERQMAQSSATTMGETFYMDPDAVFTHNLASTNDHNFYICNVTSTGWASVLLTSDTMDYTLTVGVYDAAFNPLSEETSQVPRGWYMGQRIRVPVTAGQNVVLLVQPNGNFVSGSTYNFGVLQTGYSAADNYEENDSTAKIANVGEMTKGGALFAGANLDHSYDVDWYSFTFTAESGYCPGIYLRDTTSRNITAQVFQKNSNNELEQIGTIYSNYDLQKLSSMSTKTYYFAILSTSGSSGSYYFAIQKVRAANPGQYQVFLENTRGDQGYQSYGEGTKKTARYSLSGTVLIKDYYGLPIANETVAVVFRSKWGWILDYTYVTTDANGRASFGLTPPPDINAMSKYRSGNTTYLYENSELYVLTGYHGDTKMGNEQWYWYTGCYDNRYQ